MIYLPGGPSHMDMYDLKPEAPAEFRGEFKPIQTNVPGVQICEHFPLQAQMWDKLAVIRSLDRRRRALRLAGDAPATARPSTGRRITRRSAPSSPSCAAAATATSRPSSACAACRAAWSRATWASRTGLSRRAAPAWRTCAWPTASARPRLDDRKALLASFDSVRRDIDASGTMKGLDTFTGRAFDMVASGTVRKALDLNQEDPRVRDRYKGIEDFLMARRLVEAGVGCVTLSIGGWDTHEQELQPPASSNCRRSTAASPT